tara:strand:- start:4568 stop:4819 length:252 start_codon:yes stop_codon:yes gene_type:complete
MKDINILILISCVLFLLIYFKFINLKLELQEDLIFLFNNPFFRLFSLLIIILVAHDINFLTGIFISIIYILIIEQGIKANRMK